MPIIFTGLPGSLGRTERVLRRALKEHAQVDRIIFTEDKSYSYPLYNATVYLSDPSKEIGVAEQLNRSTFDDMSFWCEYSYS
jgi:hypothetical protein